MVTFQHDQIGRIRIHLMPTDQFKTFALSLYIGMPLSAQTVTPNALIPFVLRRGTERYPETKALREKLDSLYGAGFGFDIYKRGNQQIIQFRMDTIHDQYVQGTDDLLKESLQYLGEVLTTPVTENGGFKHKYVEEEKLTLAKRQQALVNDKIRYAAERCIAEMFQDDPYRYHPLGETNVLHTLDATTLFEHYQHMLQQASIDLYISGQTTMEKVMPLVATYFHLPGQPAMYSRDVRQNERNSVHRVTEKMDVAQGKLNMGLLTGITYGDKDYAAALVYNGILGAYPHSMLFMNVREKESLAYYASSRLDGHKGFLTIQSGIQFDQVKQVEAIIIKQLEALKQGQVTELQWEQTLSMLTNQLKEMKDSAFETMAFDFNNVLTQSERTIDRLIADIRNVRMEDMQRVAQQVKLDTVYFLRSDEGGDMASENH